MCINSQFSSQPRRVSYNFHEISFVKRFKCTTLSRCLELRRASPNNHAVAVLGSQGLDEIPHVILRIKHTEKFKLNSVIRTIPHNVNHLSSKNMIVFQYFTLDMKLIESVY